MGRGSCPNVSTSVPASGRQRAWLRSREARAPQSRGTRPGAGKKPEERPANTALSTLETLMTVASPTGENNVVLFKPPHSWGRVTTQRETDAGSLSSVLPRKKPSATTVVTRVLQETLFSPDRKFLEATTITYLTQFVTKV